MRTGDPKSIILGLTFGSIIIAGLGVISLGTCLGISYLGYFIGGYIAGERARGDTVMGGVFGLFAGFLGTFVIGIYLITIWIPIQEDSTIFWEGIIYYLVIIIFIPGIVLAMFSGMWASKPLQMPKL